MPVILSPDNYDLWLDSAFRNTSSVSEMLKPFDAALRYPVSTRVNHVALYNDADCAKPRERDAAPAQAQLF
jgi:putative SOS response-associated peptidase YedK